MRTRPPAFRTLPSRTWLTPSSRAACCTRTALPLKVKTVCRAATNSAETRDRSVMMSSVRPSAKSSSSRSPPILTNGSTAIEGFDRRCAGGPRPVRPSRQIHRSPKLRPLFGCRLRRRAGMPDQGVAPGSTGRAVSCRAPALPPAPAATCLTGFEQLQRLRPLASLGMHLHQRAASLFMQRLELQ